MVDFRRHLGSKPTPRPIDPIAIYERLDRASDKGPLRPAQDAVLKSWHSSRRSERDVVLKLHTGQGKTLIGLLILQSRINENRGSAVYLCPNNFLVAQTCQQAKQFGIKYCTVEDGDLPDDFLNGNYPLITSVQKMFNGRTKFKTGAQSLDVPYVLMDDAHACIDAVRDAFKIRLIRGSNAYQRIIQLFDSALSDQGAGTFAELKNGDTEYILPVPYWDIHEKQADLIGILSDEVALENEKKKKENIWFAWPLLRDMISECQCVVSGGSLEISPYLPPLDKIGSFHKASHRIFMSATVSNDAFLIKGLRVSSAAIKNPLIYSEERWSGEKMVLVPSLIDGSLDRSAMVEEFGRPKHDRGYGVVVLAPSFAQTTDWEKYGSKVAKTDTIANRIEELKQSQFEYPIVIANRYDGIDLPDRMCRILVFDSMPHSEVLVDAYEESCRSSSPITAMRAARVIEQGLGRSVRGEKDYCAIILIGPEFVKFVRNEASRKFLSTQTRTQIELGLDVTGLAQNEVIQDNVPLTVLRGLVAQCLNRDEGWKEFYAERMNEIGPEKPDTSVLDVFDAELKAALLFEGGDVEKAIQVLQNMIDSLISDREDKCWYLQEIARMKLAVSKVESARLQMAAYRSNRYLLKPRSDVQFSPLLPISQQRVEAIKTWVKKHSKFESLALIVDELLSRLQFGTGADRFEQGLRELGEALGFSSERPDREWKAGPDNLWCLRQGEYLLIECKSDVDLRRAEIHKDETGQMNNSCAWFAKSYSGAKATNILVIPARRLSHAAGFNESVLVMREKHLRALRQNVKAFFAEFKTDDFDDLSESKIQGYIDSHHLGIEELITKYADAPQ